MKWHTQPETIPQFAAQQLAILSERFAAAGRASRPDESPREGGDFNFDPSALVPAWFRDHCPDAFTPPQLDALLARAPIWVRLQANDREMVLDEFRRKGWEPRATPVSPDAFALPPNAEVANTDAYRRGFVEIQDLGSQLVLAHASIAPGTRWLDACAGAGGKTLQLAHAVGSAGHVDATDIRPAMLEELRERAARARLTNVRTLSAADGAYDGVLVDAPCSGSGTWRRLPHMKWHTQPETIPQFAAQQLAILSANAAHVRPGGLLVYATCSLSHVENHDVAAAFLAAHAEFRAEKPLRDLGGRFDGAGTTLLPATHDSDGFYVALLRRRA
ncbi:MAG TPA: RsmB/NOP family class I SAM-dependent RNA methyltransferase, partial [Acidobacteriota bacterium]|nr:RsmB/NOP family class I SAM-dependent RNA methyltransferase [Acidobacteriota bacterium]